MENPKTPEINDTPVWVSAHRLDDTIRGLAVDMFRYGSTYIRSELSRVLPAPQVAETAWKITAGTREERDEVAQLMLTALHQQVEPENDFAVYFADQWAADNQEQWWGELYFAVNGVGPELAEIQRCAARDAANVFLESEDSPYRLP